MELKITHGEYDSLSVDVRDNEVQLVVSDGYGSGYFTITDPAEIRLLIDVLGTFKGGNDGSTSDEES